MYDSTKDILLALEKSEIIYSALVSGLSDADAHGLREGEGEWSVVEILCHLRDVEINARARTGVMVVEEFPTLETWDQNALVTEKDYQGETLENAFAAFFAERDAHLEFLRGLTREQWDRKGMHTRAGELSSKDYMMHIVAHDFDHAAQMARTIAVK